MAGSACLIIAIARCATPFAHRPGAEPRPAAASSCAAGCDAIPAEAGSALVVRVIDGDTLLLRTGRASAGRAGPRGTPAAPGRASESADVPVTAARVTGRDVRVRLIGVDAPETWTRHDCFGAEAARALARLTPPGSVLRTAGDAEPTDRYGRSLLYLWTRSGRFVNASIIRGGFARVMIVPPNTRYAHVLRAAGTAARRARVGRWAAAPTGCALGSAPGFRANIDHLAAGPRGAAVTDSKNRAKGAAGGRRVGGLLASAPRPRPASPLTPAGRGPATPRRPHMVIPSPNRLPPQTACEDASVGRTFEELVAEAEAAPVEGWDFSWLEGRATEQRPSWGYQSLMSDRLAGATAALDIQTGGGEVLAGAAKLPPTMAATEAWPPNIAQATRLLHPRGVVLVATSDEPPLPFADEAFDLVVSRHPATVWWTEIRSDRALGRSPGTARTSSSSESIEHVMIPNPAGAIACGGSRRAVRGHSP